MAAKKKRQCNDLMVIFEIHFTVFGPVTPTIASPLSGLNNPPDVTREVLEMCTIFGTKKCYCHTNDAVQATLKNNEWKKRTRIDSVRSLPCRNNVL